MKKTLSLALSLLMILSTLTVLPISALADTAISAVNLTYDGGAIKLNTAYTEREADMRVRDYTDAVGDGYTLHSSGLRYMPYDSWYGIGNGSNQVQSDRKYGIEYTLALNSGYDWLDDVKAFTTQTAITECPAFTVNVNGVKRTDVTIEFNDYWKYVTIWVPIENASTAPIITGIEIEGNDISLGVGETHTFVASIKGTAADKTINWSVDGAASATTTITSGGLLTVGADETAETITVKATSNFDSTQFAQKTVTVLSETPTIDSVTVSPKEITLRQRSTHTFSVTVEGTQSDKSVVWTVDGATSAGTTISDSGLLTVAVDEGAATLTVKATAVQDSTKFDTATVTVQELTRINAVSLTYDAESIKLTTAYTEGEVKTRVKNYSFVQGESCTVNDSYLMYLSEDSWYGIGTGENQVQSDRQYGIEYMLKLKDGYEWIEAVKPFTSQTAVTECPEFTVNINGVKRTDVMIEYNDYWNYLDIFVPIDFYHVHISDNGTVTKKATPTSTGIKVYKCTECGQIIKTEIIAKTAKYNNTLTLKAKSPIVKFSKLWKKSQTVALKKWITVSKAQGKVTFKKSSGNKKITVSKAGKITVKKGLKKGTYKVKIKVTAAGNATYKAKTKTVTVKIKVK